MHTKMMNAFGYDGWGNAPHLLCEQDKEALDSGDYLRVGGKSNCPVCGCTYEVHPVVQGALWLRRGCEGLVKL